MDIAEIREKIPALQQYTHLNCAAVSPLFSDSVRVIQESVENRGGKGNFDYFGWIEEMQECKKKIAALINGSSDEIAFMLNTTEGINTVASMIPWKKGDTVITSDLEFPSNSIPWYYLQKKGVEVKTIRNVNGEIRPEDIERALDDHTKLVALSYVQFGNGFRADVAEIAKICKEHDALLFCDVIQGLGAVNLDVRKTGIDFFAAAGYKWLMGPLGVGIFYIKKENIERFDPPYIGWFSLKEEADQEMAGLDHISFAESAQRFETGGKSFALLKGLEASVDALLDIGIKSIEKRVLHLSQYVIDRAEHVITPRDEKKRAGIVNMDHPNPEKAVERLGERDILVSPRMGGIRVSTHFWNTEEDIDRLFEHL
jgi:selenocysteine lyase/cysteine desulfurase